MASPAKHLQFVITIGAQASHRHPACIRSTQFPLFLQYLFIQGGICLFQTIPSHILPLSILLFNPGKYPPYDTDFPNNCSSAVRDGIGG